MVIMCVCVLLYEKWNVYVHEVSYDVYNMEYEKVCEFVIYRLLVFLRMDYLLE